MKFLTKHKRQLLILALIIGVAARILVAFRGHNFDVDSYWIVGDIVDKGGNVYLETARYNYGPIWFHLIGLLYKLTSGFTDHFLAFRIGVTLLLTFVDLGIAWVLLKKYGTKIALLFFLNPVSIIITGYHSQFDNLAILLGLLAIITLGDKQYNGKQPRFWAGLALLGISLITKHILFALPLWIAVKQKDWKAKLLSLAVPIGLFLFSFLPYWADGRGGIIQNVFLYKSFDNAPFWHSIMPAIVSNNLPTFGLFLATLTIFAFVFRKRKLLDTFVLYLGVLVIFSSAVANQYLAIAIPFVAVYWSWVAVLFTIVTTIYLLVDVNGLHIATLQRLIPIKLVAYNIQISILFGSFVWAFRRENIKRIFNTLVRKAKEEIRLQLPRR